MASTRQDLHHAGTGGSHDHLPVPSGSKVTFSRFFVSIHGHVAVLFRVDDQDSPWNELEVFDTPRSAGIPVSELSDYIRFDSHEEHLVYQQALTAHHLGEIAASLGNMEGHR